MTSSCFHYGSWMTILLCLFPGGAPKGPVGLADTNHPSTCVKVCLDHAWAAGFVHFCTKNDDFGLESIIIPKFFSTFLHLSRFYVLFFGFEPSLS